MFEIMERLPNTPKYVLTRVTRLRSITRDLRLKYACLLGIIDVLIRIVRRWDSRRSVCNIGGPAGGKDTVVGGVDKFFSYVARLFKLRGFTFERVNNKREGNLDNDNNNNNETGADGNLPEQEQDKQQETGSNNENDEEMAAQKEEEEEGEGEDKKKEEKHENKEIPIEEALGFVYVSGRINIDPKLYLRITCHLAACCLIFDDYSTDLTSLSGDLRQTRVQTMRLFEQIGCNARGAAASLERLPLGE